MLRKLAKYAQADGAGEIGQRHVRAVRDDGVADFIELLIEAAVAELTFVLFRRSARLRVFTVLFQAVNCVTDL